MATTTANSIHSVTGDILLSGSQAIAHGVSPNDPFHSGLALALREKWPAMYKDFRHYCQTNHPKPGTIWEWAGTSDHGSVRIVALLTQDGGYEHGAKPGRASAANVNHALKALRAWAEAEGVTSIALPRLATGVGGLTWETVEPLIKQHLGSMKATVSVYTTYQKGVKAKEA